MLGAIKMAIVRSIGKVVGTVGGTVIGGSVKLVGKAVSTKWEGAGEWIEDVGDSVNKASVHALENAGQFLDGTIQGAYGILKDDEYYKDAGIQDIKESSKTTLKGIGSTITYTAKNIGTTYEGIKNGDKEEIVDGLKNVGKIAAVSCLAIGAFDVIDGIDGVDVAEASELDTSDVQDADINDAESTDTANSGDIKEIDTINEDLNGDEHPDTGVPFESKIVQLPNGDAIEGVFPIFDSSYNATIPEEMYLDSDDAQFDVANDQLYQAIRSNPSLADEIGLSQEEVQGLAYGQTPEGFTWYHNEEPGVLQLLDEEIHAETGHTGGRSIWGGGTDNR